MLTRIAKAPTPVQNDTSNPLNPFANFIQVLRIRIVLLLAPLPVLGPRGGCRSVSLLKRRLSLWRRERLGLGPVCSMPSTWLVRSSSARLVCSSPARSSDIASERGG